MDRLAALVHITEVLRVRRGPAHSADAADSSAGHFVCQRYGWLTLAVGVLGASSCTAFLAEPTPEPGVVLHYHSADPGLLQSTLSLAPLQQRMSAITHTADGSCLTEQVRLDSAGRVLDGKTSLAAADSSKSREVVLDAVRGFVEVTTPTFHIYWHVPQDLPWAWTSLLSDQNSGAPVATPLGAIVAQRAATADAAVRWLDIAAFQSHSIMADQLLIPEDGAATVVLGDDWAELSDRVPTRMHIAGLDTLLEGDDLQLLCATLAACDCTDRRTLHARSC